MGSCGCFQGNEVAKFKGPDDFWYVLEIYPGCKDCNQSPGTTILRYTKDDMERFDLKHLQELDFPGCGVGVPITILSGRDLRESLVKSLKEDIGNGPFDVDFVSDTIEEELPDMLIKEANEARTLIMIEITKNQPVESKKNYGL